MRGQAEQHEGERVLQPVAAPADAVERVDEVEAREQRQEAEQHEHQRGDDLPAEVAAQRLHARATSLRSDQRGSVVRRQNRMPASASTAACSTQEPTENDSFCPAIQACTSEIRLL